MFNEYRPTFGYDEYFCQKQSAPRADLEPLLSSLGQIGLTELNRNHASAGNLLRRLGATFRLNGTGLDGGRKDPALRSPATAHSPSRLGQARTWAHPAVGSRRSVFSRCVWTTKNPEGWRDSTGRREKFSGLETPDARHPAPVESLVPHLGSGSDPRRRGHMARAGRQPALSIRCGLFPREPMSDGDGVGLIPAPEEKQPIATSCWRAPPAQISRQQSRAASAGRYQPKAT